MKIRKFTNVDKEIILIVKAIKMKMIKICLTSICNNSDKYNATISWKRSQLNKY